MYSGGDSQIPVLFSLYHPLEEPRPVSLVFENEMETLSEWIINEHIRVLHIIPQKHTPLLVAWDDQKRQHLIWTLHEEKKKDMKEVEVHTTDEGGDEMGENELET
jgi:hypothetical protein